MGAGAAAVVGAAGVAGAAVAAGAVPCNVAAPSATVGTWIVEPRTTWASSGRPLYAATVRVVRLFAAAIDHSVSPGWTVCATEAAAGAAGIRLAAKNKSS